MGNQGSAGGRSGGPVQDGQSPAQTGVAQIGLASAPNSPGHNDSPAPRQSPRLWNMFTKRRKAPRKKMQPGDEVDDENINTPSPAKIRHMQLQQMQMQRPQLTERQLQLLADTWQVLQRHEDLGKDMFVRLFETYPEVKGAFGPFKSMAADDIRLSRELRAHGLRVMNTINKLMATRRDQTASVDHLLQLGQRHITYNVKIDYIDIVGQQFLFAIEPILKEDWSPEVEQAWADLFRFISHVMREAMVM